MKSISTLTTTIIIVAVVISISIAYALWITSMTTNTIRERYVKLEFYEANIAIKTIILYVKNTGSTETTITHVIVNNNEAPIIWAWDLTDQKYLGYGEALIKPGHAVEIAVKTPSYHFTPGVMIDIKILTSMGITLYRTVELTSHPVLNYVSKGYLNAWDYDPQHYSAIYHQFWRYYGLDLILGTNVKKISISYNMWYGLFQLGQDYSIIHEIYLYKNNPYYFDIKAYKNGSIVFYDSVTGEEIFTNFRVNDPHNYVLEFTSYPTGEVEFKLVIDGKIVVSKNYTGLQGAYIIDECFGVWDPAGLYDMYIDNIVEKILWTNGSETSTVEDFDDLSTNYFTAYILDGNLYDITSYPIKLYDGKIGYVIDKI